MSLLAGRPVSYFYRRKSKKTDIKLYPSWADYQWKFCRKSTFGYVRYFYYDIMQFFVYIHLLITRRPVDGRIITFGDSHPDFQISPSKTDDSLMIHESLFVIYCWKLSKEGIFLYLSRRLKSYSWFESDSWFVHAVAQAQKKIKVIYRVG